MIGDKENSTLGSARSLTYVRTNRRGGEEAILKMSGSPGRSPRKPLTGGALGSWGSGWSSVHWALSAYVGSHACSTVSWSCYSVWLLCLRISKDSRVYSSLELTGAFDLRKGVQPAFTAWLGDRERRGSRKEAHFASRPFHVFPPTPTTPTGKTLISVQLCPSAWLSYLQRW